MARRATFIAQQRAENSNLLLLDAGDSLYGDDDRNQPSQGALAVEALNLMGYDAVALGAADLQWGVQVLQARIQQASFALLSANVYVEQTGDLLAEPYTIIELGGRPVGIIGLTGQPEQPVAGLEVRDPQAAAQTQVALLAPQVDLLILLSHQTWEQNVALAGRFGEVDLIVAGSPGSPQQASYTAPTTGTRLVQAESPVAGHAGRVIGRWAFQLDALGKVHVGDWQVIELGPDYADDAAMLDLLSRYGGQ